MGFLAGPLSDRYKLLKLPIVFSTLFLALGALSIFFLKMIPVFGFMDLQQGLEWVFGILWIIY